MPWLSAYELPLEASTWEVPTVVHHVFMIAMRK
jgi:hypothetical protein